MLQPIYNLPLKPPESKVKIVRILSKGNGQAFVTSNYISAWHINVSSHFRSSGALNLTKPMKPPAIEFVILNWIMTFFSLAVAASIFSFGGFAGAYTEITKFIALFFVVLFALTLLYNLVLGHRTLN